MIFVRQAPDLSMMFSLYVTLGIFLLLAVRNPSESRSLIAFTAWSSFAHAAVMGLQLPMQGVSLCPPRQQTPAHRRGGVGACCDRERLTRHREAMGSGWQTWPARQAIQTRLVAVEPSARTELID